MSTSSSIPRTSNTPDMTTTTTSTTADSSASKRSSAHSLGTVLSDHTNSTVRDKIRTWQKQSGGAGRIADVLPHDIPRETGGGFADAAARRKSFPVPEPEEPRKSRRERTKTDISFTVHEPEPSRDKPATIRPEHDQGYDGETELSGAPGRRPKKRVISDGHWRKDRHAPKPTKSKDVQPRKKNELLDSYVQNRPPAVSPRSLAVPFTPYSSGLSSPPGSFVGLAPRRHGASGRTKSQSRDVLGDITEGETEREDRPRTRNRTRTRSVAATDRTGYMSDYASGREGDETPRERTSRMSLGHVKSKSLDASRARFDAERLRPPPMLRDTRERSHTSPLSDRRSSKGPNVLSALKEKESRTTGRNHLSTAHPGSKGSNIEAWLSSMEDPSAIAEYDGGGGAELELGSVSTERRSSFTTRSSRRKALTDVDVDDDDFVPYSKASLAGKGSRKSRSADRKRERAKTEPRVALEEGKGSVRGEKERAGEMEVRHEKPLYERELDSLPRVERERSGEMEVGLERPLLSREPVSSPRVEKERPVEPEVGFEKPSHSREPIYPPRVEKERPLGEVCPDLPMHSRDPLVKKRGELLESSGKRIASPFEKKSVKSRIQAFEVPKQEHAPPRKLHTRTKTLESLQPREDVGAEVGEGRPDTAPGAYAARKEDGDRVSGVKNDDEVARPQMKERTTEYMREETNWKRPKTAAGSYTPRFTLSQSTQEDASALHRERKHIEAEPAVNRPETASGNHIPEQKEEDRKSDTKLDKDYPQLSQIEFSRLNVQFATDSQAREHEPSQVESANALPDEKSEEEQVPDRGPDVEQEPQQEQEEDPHVSPEAQAETAPEPEALQEPEPEPQPQTPEDERPASYKDAQSPEPPPQSIPEEPTTASPESTRQPATPSAPHEMHSFASPPTSRKTGSTSRRRERRSTTPLNWQLPSPGGLDLELNSFADEFMKEPPKTPEAAPAKPKPVEPVKPVEQNEPSRKEASPIREAVSGSRLAILQQSLEEALQETVPENAVFSDDGHDQSYQDQSYQGSILDRPPPLKFKRQAPMGAIGGLSTILSTEEEDSPRASILPSLLGAQQSKDAQASQGDDDVIPGGGAGLERKLTTHRELMSRLSSNKGSQRKVSRTGGSRRVSKKVNTPVSEILQDLTADEARYMRELRTLAGAVIPVLLNSVTSQAEFATTAGLFRPSADPEDIDNFAQPILAMGDSLKQLKARHKAMPLDDIDKLPEWADGSQKVYETYLRNWRLGFQDVIINLDPPEREKNHDDESLYDGGMSQDSDGDVIDDDGVKVDVAFLLKRPLVRLKYLAKTFKTINATRPGEKAERIAKVYQQLVTDARKRAHEERARLEDEAAAAVDATRARNLKDLGPSQNVKIDKTRRVRARDPFGLSLLHTSGQQIDCECELIYRDNPPDSTPGGDLLICEVDQSGRWLLFTPIERGRASARKGNKKDELVVMIRGVPGEEEEWKELLCLQADDEEIADDWVSMIGLSPVPPAINRSFSFANRQKQKATKPPPGFGPTDSLFTAIQEESVVSSSGVNVPIGEAPRPHGPILGFRAAENKDQVLKGPTRSGAGKSSLRRAQAQKRKPKHDQGPQEGQSPEGSGNPVSRDQNPRSGSPEPAEDGLLHPSRPKDAKQTGQRVVSPKPNAAPPANPKLRKPSPRVSTDNKGEPPESAPTTFDDIITPSTPSTPSSRNSVQGGIKLQGPWSPAPHAASGNVQKRRRSSSPLKREVARRAESQASHSSESIYEHPPEEQSSSSSDEDLESENEVVPPPRVSSRGHGRLPPFAPHIVPDGVHIPIDVAQPQKPAFEPVTCNAHIFHWDDKGIWNALYPSECILRISGGLIEAYEMSLAPLLTSAKEGMSIQTSPLIALELTPLVPVRRGTAVDISVRSPPTANSRLQPGNNIMFRSHNTEECDRLYSFINLSRTNNPTYIALQSARQAYPIHPPVDQSEQIESRKFSHSIFGALGIGRRASYRAKQSNNTPRSTSGATESSGTMANAIGALKKLGRTKMFNNRKPTVASRQGSGSGGDGSQYSNASSGSGSNAEGLIIPGIGITNAKIRLYMRLAGNKWGDLGAARLTILPADGNAENPSAEAQSPVNTPPRQSTDSGSRSPSRMAQPPAHPKANEKRIVVTAKNGKTMIDACLGESCFERVARTGIAVSVYEDSPVGVGKQGGVMIGNFKVYMIQMRSEAETAYTFGLVGKLRY